MSRRHLLSTVLILSFFLGGCTSAFKKPDQNADYGITPTNIREQVTTHFSQILKDPDSAKYNIGKPRKTYVNQGLIYGGTVAFTAYMVPVEVNAKNSFGGYVGFKPYMTFFKNGVLIKHVEGTSHVLVHEIGPPIDVDVPADKEAQENTQRKPLGEQMRQASEFSTALNCSPEVELLKAQHGREVYSSNCASGRMLLFACQWRQCELLE